MYDIRRKGKWNRVNGTGNYTHWLFENSMRFQWSCIKMEIHRCISGLIGQQSRGGGWALRWRHVTVWRKRDRRQDQGLINWSREDRTQWKGETWGKGRAKRLEMGIKGVDAGSTGRDNDPGGLGDQYKQSFDNIFCCCCWQLWQFVNFVSSASLFSVSIQLLALQGWGQLVQIDGITRHTLPITFTLKILEP